MTNESNVNIEVVENIRGFSVFLGVPVFITVALVLLSTFKKRLIFARKETFSPK